MLALILVDPPIGAKIYVHNAMRSSPIPLSIDVQWPYQGGYTDFNALNYKATTSYNGPPRTSLYDDLIYYHLQDQVIRPTKVEEAPLLLKRILDGHWMTSVACIETSVSILEFAVEQSRENNSDNGASRSPSYRGLKWLEEQLFHIYSWKRRVSRYFDWSACNLLELNISQPDYADLGQSSFFVAAISIDQNQKKRTGSLSNTDSIYTKNAVETWSHQRLGSYP